MVRIQATLLLVPILTPGMPYKRLDVFPPACVTTKEPSQCSPRRWTIEGKLTIRPYEHLGRQFDS